MSEHTKRGPVQDRAKAAGGQKHETTYESHKTGTTSNEVRAAVRKVGNSRDNDETGLKKRK